MTSTVKINYHNGTSEQYTTDFNHAVFDLWDERVHKKEPISFQDVSRRSVTINTSYVQSYTVKRNV